MSRFVPSVGFVVAGLGIAASVVEWTGVLTVAGVGSVAGVAFALLATGAFAARRYGLEDHRLPVAAGIGSAGLSLVAAASLLYPVTVGETVSFSWGLPAAFVIGIVGTGIAYADWHDVERDAFVEKGFSGVAALGIGVLGLLVGYTVAFLGVSIIPGASTLLVQGVSTALFSVGLGIVALGFLKLRRLGFDYIDVAWPDRRGWLSVVGGVLAMFAILIAIGQFAEWLGIPSTQHGIIEAARDEPTMLLAFIPLSWLAIGPGEELLSRNIIQKYLYDSYSRRSAILVGTLVFTAIHLPAYATGSAPAIFATLVRLFAISLVLGVVYERTDNVVVAALVHGTYDAIQFGLAYVAITSGYF